MHFLWQNYFQHLLLSKESEWKKSDIRQYLIQDQKLNICTNDRPSRPEFWPICICQVCLEGGQMLTCALPGLSALSCLGVCTLLLMSVLFVPSPFLWSSPPLCSFPLPHWPINRPTNQQRSLFRRGDLLCSDWWLHCLGGCVFWWTSSPKYGLLADRYHFCERCFTEIQGENITLGEDPAQPQT